MQLNIVRKWNAFHDKRAELYLDKARRGGIWAVYKLFNRYYLKSFFGPFFTFIFPPVILAILGSFQNGALIFSGIAAMSAMSAGISGMPFTILELKKSVLLKRIGSSPVKPWTFTVVIISYFTFTIFLSILWLMVWSLLFFRDPSMFNPLGTVVGFFGFLYGNLLNIIMSLSIGFAVATFAKSEVSAQTIGTLIYFPAAFLSGQFIAINNIASNDIMDVISRILPFRYTTMIIVESWSGNVIAPFAINGVVDSAGTIGVLYNQGDVISSGNPFAIHDYVSFAPRFLSLSQLISTEAAATTDADKLQALQNLMDAEALKGFTFRIYDVPDHIVAYIFPYVTIGLSTFYSIRKFSWSAGR